MAPLQTRILTLNKGEHQEKTLYRLEKGKSKILESSVFALLKYFFRMDTAIRFGPEFDGT